MISHELPAEKVGEFLNLFNLNYERPKEDPNQWLSRTHGAKVRRELGDRVDGNDAVGAYDLIWSWDDAVGAFLHVTSGSTLVAMELMGVAASGRRRVVDVGCGSGLAANFIAWSHPEALVVGIDASENGIAFARRTAANLNLSNVSFVTARLQDFNPVHEFDLVVSSLVAADVAPFGVLWEQFDDGDDFDEMCDTNLSSTAHWYSRLLAELMSPDGRLLTLERLPTGFEMAAWLGCLQSEGLSVDLSQSDFVYSRSWAGGSPERMPMFFLRHGDQSISALELRHWVETFPLPSEVL